MSYKESVFADGYNVYKDDKKILKVRYFFPTWMSKDAKRVLRKDVVAVMEKALYELDAKWSTAITQTEQTTKDESSSEPSQ
jgi:hypothetical protein